MPESLSSVVTSLNGKTGDVTVETDRPIAGKDRAETFTESDVTLTTTDCGVNQGNLDLTYGLYDLSKLSENQQLSVGALPSDVGFADDGGKMYVTTTDPTLREYSLSNPFDVSTATLDNETSWPDAETAGIHVKNDGTKFYASSSSDEFVHQYGFGQNYDITTLTEEHTVDPPRDQPVGLAFKPDGSKLFIASYYNDAYLLEYTLSTPFDISTASFVQEKLLSYSPDPSLDIKPDGSRLYINDGSLREYDLPTSFDISEISLIDTYQTPTSDSVGGVFDQIGSKFYYTDGDADAVIELSVGSRSLSGSATVEWPDPDNVFAWDAATFAASPDGGAVKVYIEESTDGGETWTTIAGPISRGQDITAAPDSEMRFRVELSRPDTANDTSLDAIYRRWVV